MRSDSAVLLEKFDEYRGGVGYRDSLTFGCDREWAYFRDALDEHEKRVEALKAVGLLEAYVDLSNSVKAEIVRTANAFGAIAKEGQSLWASLDYDPANFKLRRVEVKLLEEGAPEPPATLAKRSYLSTHGSRTKISISKAAHNLWHGLMNKVLEAIPGVS